MTDTRRDTFAGVLDEEHCLAMESPEKYGEAFEVAAHATSLLASFIHEVRPHTEIFGRWLSQVTKHQMLALLSTVRRHRVQAQMDLRQVLESACRAAYALGNPEVEKHTVVMEGRAAGVVPKYREKVYRWLDREYPEESRLIKIERDHINETTAHSYIHSSHLNFANDVQGRRMDVDFFDADDPWAVKTSLLLSARLAVMALELLLKVNTTHAGFTVRADAQPRYLRVISGLEVVRADLMTDPRFESAVEAMRVEHAQESER